MIYIFEDGPGQSLQKLILQCYPKDRFNNDIFFTSGNRNILAKLDELIGSGRTTEDIVIYLDLVPDNKNTRLVYQQLDKEYKNKFRRLIVLPIPCIEYYYIIAQQRQERFIKDPKSVNIAIHRGWHQNSQLKSQYEDRRTYWQFEKFCKLVVKRGLIDCLHNWTANTHHIEYFQTHCKNCRREKCFCIDGNRPSFQINVKKKNLLYAFPCVPSGSSWYEPTRLMEWGDLITLHRRLVGQYNLMCDRYNKIIASNLGLQDGEKVPPDKRCKTVKSMY